MLNGTSGTNPYVSGLLTAPAYAHVDGHAIFVPISQLFTTPITQWPPDNWDWTFLDGLIQTAVTNHKAFSLELEVGFQGSLPQGFETACNPSGQTGSQCAPLFHIWTSSQVCLPANVPLPWNPNVQQFWQTLATKLAAHLAGKDNQLYPGLKLGNVLPQLTLIHLPGVSVYDEEIRLPSGYPIPPSGMCPEAGPTGDVLTWPMYGYSYANVASGFSSIATAFAQAFPDVVLGMSLFQPLEGTNTIDFPADPAVTTNGQAISPLCPTTTYFATTQSGSALTQCLVEILAGANGVAVGRAHLQADDLGSKHLSALNWILPEVAAQAMLFTSAQHGKALSTGWQSNKQGGKGALCCGTSSTGAVCGTTAAPCDAEAGASASTVEGSITSYFDLLKEGWEDPSGTPYGVSYLEVWSYDVVSYPVSFDAATSAPNSFYSN